ncbi:MAG TPA: prepilin-type N-terminal cleavage/methylation domain-containing protein [Thermoanaerobaculia bacterium]|nr:prepilin-type N-terminal cleavage/methylation domain-containing protein [Thermoanaerobaculia bacterium]
MRSILRVRPRQRGFSLMEVTVVLAITTVVLLIVMQMLDNAVSTSLFVESRNDLPIMGQSAVNAMQARIFQARQIFEDDTLGQDYWKALDFTGLPAVQANSLQPVINEPGTFVPDTTTRYTGNCLLVARHLTPMAIDTTGSPAQVLADLYEFNAFYLTQSTARNFANQGYTLDLFQGTSGSYADYDQLNDLINVAKLTSTQMKAINKKLIDNGITLAWNAEAPVTSAFYSINLDGTLSGPNATQKIVLRATKSKSLLTGLTGGRISGRMAYTVGFRKPADGTNFPVRDTVPKYAKFDSTKKEFPSGLEFLIVGPQGSRRILARLVMVSQYGVNKWDSREMTVVTSAR